jgi:hypothetical protein
VQDLGGAAVDGVGGAGGGGDNAEGRAADEEAPAASEEARAISFIAACSFLNLFTRAKGGSNFSPRTAST